MSHYAGFGSLRRLDTLLCELGCRRLFLVTGEASFRAGCAAGPLANILAAYRTVRFSGFSNNPRIQDIERGRALLKASGSDLVLAIGGGSALDTAKAINLLAAQDGPAEDFIRNPRAIARPGRPLIAIPTTAGSGSEATHFAVLYVGHIKHSLTHEFLRPGHVILDPTVTLNLPPYLTACSGMDALSQAIESCWSIHATPASSRDAEAAIRLILDHLPAAVNRPTATAREALLNAAHLAGRAIDVTKTTAPHALSYPITMHFGVPHGHAVALTLPQFFIHNAQVTERNVTDPRGVEYVRQCLARLCILLGASDAQAAAARLTLLMGQIGLETELAALGIRTPADLDLILDEVNLERLGNNPCRLTRADLRQLLTSLTVPQGHHADAQNHRPDPGMDA